VGWLFSDIPASIQWQYSGGKLTEWRNPSGKSNGMIVDTFNGTSLLTCEHEGRRVQRQDLSTKEVTTVVDEFMGKKLNSPNDLAVLKDGTIYFTDPDYGVMSPFGHSDPKEQDGNYVYRWDPVRGVTNVSNEFIQPNGIAFSADEKFAFIADTGEGHNWIRKFDVKDDGSLEPADVNNGSAILVRSGAGAPDGVRVDSLGNVWSTETGNKVAAYNSDTGAKLLEITFDKQPSNLAFGGADGKTLMVTVVTDVWTIPTKVSDARSQPQAVEEVQI